MTPRNTKPTFHVTTERLVALLRCWDDLSSAGRQQSFAVVNGDQHDHAAPEVLDEVTEFLVMAAFCGVEDALDHAEALQRERRRYAFPAGGGDLRAGE